VLLQKKKLLKKVVASPPPKQVLPAFFPSHDGRCKVSTILTAVETALCLGRPLMTESTTGLGQAVAMTGMVQTFRSELRANGAPIKDGQKVRGLWIEDDIILSPSDGQEIAKMILKADEKGWNIVAPYATGLRDISDSLRDPILKAPVEKRKCPHCRKIYEEKVAKTENWTYFHMPQKEGEIGGPFTLEEIRALKPYDRIYGLAGLGFYYGDIYLDYVWYEGTYNGRDRFGLPSYSGIDWNYFLDNHVELRHYPLRIAHEKPTTYDNVKALKFVSGDSWMAKWLTGKTQIDAAASTRSRSKRPRRSSK
jgi:phage FluMu protein Com